MKASTRWAVAGAAAIAVAAASVGFVTHESPHTSLKSGGPPGSGFTLGDGTGGNSSGNTTNGTDWLGALEVTTTIRSSSPTTRVPTPTIPPKTTTTPTTIRPPGLDAVAFQLDAAHTGSRPTDADLPAALHKRWSRDLNGEVGYPLIVGDRIFVSTIHDVGGQPNDGGTIYAFARDTGQQLWAALIGPGPDHAPEMLGLAYDKGRVFTVTIDGDVRAYDATTGHLDWHYDVPAMASGDFGGQAPVASGGIVYVAHQWELLAMREDDGTPLWTVDMQNPPTPPAVVGTTVYTTDGCPTPYALDATNGATRWSFPFTCVTGTMRNVTSFYANRLWTRAGGTDAVYDTAGSVVGSFAALSAPTFAGDTALYLAKAGHFEAHDIDSGSLLWHQNDVGLTEVPPLAIGDRVFVTDAAGVVHEYDAATGASRWESSTGVAPLAYRNDPGFDYAKPLLGMAEAHGVLAVPVADRLTIFG